MRIEAELDFVHGERLQALQNRLHKPLPEVLAIAIDAALSDLEPEDTHEKSALYEALKAIGLIGCIDDDQSWSADYKQHLDFSSKRSPPSG
jgi:hypothetical protein